MYCNKDTMIVRQEILIQKENYKKLLCAQLF